MVSAWEIIVPGSDNVEELVTREIGLLGEAVGHHLGAMDVSHFLHRLVVMDCLANVDDICL